MVRQGDLAPAIHRRGQKLLLLLLGRTTRWPPRRKWGSRRRSWAGRRWAGTGGSRPGQCTGLHTGPGGQWTGSRGLWSRLSSDCKMTCENLPGGGIWSNLNVESWHKANQGQDPKKFWIHLFDQLLASSKLWIFVLLSDISGTQMITPWQFCWINVNVRICNMLVKD